MRTTDAKPKVTLGFLTMVEHPDCGLCGGYLVLNAVGRPLEFHCTAPVRPNRAQQILYGPTLESYLFGELIGQTLINRSKIEPLVVCTDCPSALAVREFVAAPVALVLGPENLPQEEIAVDSSQSEQDAAPVRLDECYPGPRLVTFRLGRNRLAVPSLASGDRQLIADRLAVCAETMDFGEPFERIRLAIEEARRGGQAA